METLDIDILSQSNSKSKSKTKVQSLKSKVKRMCSDSTLLCHHKKISFKILCWIVTKSSPTLVIIEHCTKTNIIESWTHWRRLLWFLMWYDCPVEIVNNNWLPGKHSHLFTGFFSCLVKTFLTQLYLLDLQLKIYL